MTALGSIATYLVPIPKESTDANYIRFDGSSISENDVTDITDRFIAIVLNAEAHQTRCETVVRLLGHEPGVYGISRRGVLRKGGAAGD